MCWRALARESCSQSSVHMSSQDGTRRGMALVHVVMLRFDVGTGKWRR